MYKIAFFISNLIVCVGAGVGTTAQCAKSIRGCWNLRLFDLFAKRGVNV